MKGLPISTVRVENFKAIRDTGTLRLSPVTVLVGNNGSGKSSLIEAMETIRRLAYDGLDAAMEAFHGFDHIRNQHAAANRGRPKPIRFRWAGKTWMGGFEADVAIATREPQGGIGLSERLRYRRAGTPVTHVARGSDGRLAGGPFDGQELPEGTSSLRWLPAATPRDWQFLSVEPGRMGEPRPKKGTAGPAPLERDGSNIGEYLLSLRDADADAFEGVIETLRAVLPYAGDVQPRITSELERTVYIQLTEGSFKVPGWLLSSGTLRILAILAVLRHPKPPSVVFIEEIENGLDPRTLHLVARELQRAAEGGGPQVIATTHSPFLLDLLPLSSLMFVERIGGEPVFTRPADDAAVRAWGERFSPGQLYTMGRFDRARPA